MPPSSRSLTIWLVGISALATPATAQAPNSAQGQLRQQQFNEQMRQGYEQSRRAAGQSQQQVPSAPPPPWQPMESSYQTTFGAMAKARDDKQFAFSVGRYYATDAAAEAKDKCEKQSGQSCSVERTFKNACATLSWPTTVGRQPIKLSEAALAIETTSVQSQKVAVSGCEKMYGAQCRIGYMACASPALKADMGGDDLWSAVAIDPSTLTIFPAMRGGYNRASARATAYDLCQRDSRTAGNCQVLDHFQAGECWYLAQSPAGIYEGDYKAIVRERPDADTARRLCEAKAGTACTVVWHACT